MWWIKNHGIFTYKENTLLLVNVVDLFGNEEEGKRKVRGRKIGEREKRKLKRDQKRKEKGKQSRGNLKKRKIKGLWNFWNREYELNLISVVFFQSTHNSRLIIRLMLYKYQLKYSTKYLTSQFSRSVMSDSLQPMDCSTPGFSVHHQFPELAQMHVHEAGDAIQQFHPLSSPFPPAFNLFQHQGLFQWVSSLHQVAKVLKFQLQHQSFQWIPRTDLL